MKKIIITVFTVAIFFAVGGTLSANKAEAYYGGYTYSYAGNGMTNYYGYNSGYSVYNYSNGYSYITYPSGYRTGVYDNGYGTVRYEHYSDF